MSRCLLKDSVPGEAVTSIQSNEGERQDSMWIISGEVVLAWGESTQRPRNLPAILTHTYRWDRWQIHTESGREGHRICALKNQSTKQTNKKTALAIYCSVNFHEVLIASSDHLFSFLGGSRKCTEGYFSLFVARNGGKKGKEGDEIAAFYRCSVSL